MAKESNWYIWNQGARKWDYQQTEDHIFAPYSLEPKRIGDMDRDGLIHVIAAQSHDRERLAAALLSVLESGNTPDPITLQAVDLAKAIMRRVEQGAK